jgi:hypothetical protein
LRQESSFCPSQHSSGREKQGFRKLTTHIHSLKEIFQKYNDYNREEDVGSKKQ